MSMPEPDTLTLMTDDMHHLFVVNGCNPTCHCCNNKIAVGDSYKLGHVTQQNCIDDAKLDGARIFKSSDEHDVMLCGSSKCSPHNMIINHIERLKKYKEEGLTVYGNWNRGGGCSIINGVIVP